MKTLAREKIRRASVAPARRKLLGLCSSCKHALICTYPRDPQRPVLQCEEFEGYPPRPVKRTLPRATVKAKARPASEYKGLCSNCENREACTYPKAESGVWRCEEYK